MIDYNMKLYFAIGNIDDLDYLYEIEKWFKSPIYKRGDLCDQPFYKHCEFYTSKEDAMNFYNYGYGDDTEIYSCEVLMFGLPEGEIVPIDCKNIELVC